MEPWSAQRATSPASFFFRRSISSFSFLISLSRPKVLVPRADPPACADSGRGNKKESGSRSEHSNIRCAGTCATDNWGLREHIEFRRPPHLHTHTVANTHTQDNSAWTILIDIDQERHPWDDQYLKRGQLKLGCLGSQTLLCACRYPWDVTPFSLWESTGNKEGRQNVPH